MKSSMGSGLRLITAIGAVAVFALPIYIVLVNSVKPGDQIRRDPLGLPSAFTLEHFAGVLDPSTGFAVSLIRSIVITFCSTIPSLILAAGLGYTLSRHTGRFAQAAQLLLLLGIMIPTQVVLVPIATLLDAVGLLGSYLGLIIFNIGYTLPFGVFVFSRFAAQVPRELDEAAALDGAGPVRTFTSIMLPTMRPAVASVVIFFGVWIWNDFLSPLLLLGPKEGTTVTTGIYQAVGMFQTDYGAMFALMVLAATPVVGAYLVMQRQFVEGLTSGAIKG